MELSILRYHRHISNKSMKNQGENKNSSNEFPDLIGPLYICRLSLSNTCISDLKRENKHTSAHVQNFLGMLSFARLKRTCIS